MANSYIPSTNSGFGAWLLNFSTLLTAAPALYGLVSGDAVIVAAQNVAYQAALLAATDPTTRTSVTVAALAAAKANALAVVRPYAVQISQNPSVLNDDKVAIGVTVRKVVPSPIVTPTAVPLVSLIVQRPLEADLKVVNSDTPTSKAKPFGSIGVQVFASIGTAAATDPSQLSYDYTATKIPTTMQFASEDRGKVVSVAARYVTRGGLGGKSLVGPWSAITTFTVA